jgi:hypothetical protein
MSIEEVFSVQFSVFSALNSGFDHPAVFLQSEPANARPSEN